MFCLSNAGRSGRFRLLEFAWALAAGRWPRLSAWMAAVAASNADVIRSCCLRSSVFSWYACSAILRSSSAVASAGMVAILGVSMSSASAKASSSNSWAAVGGKNWGPESRAGEGDREPRPRPRGWLTSCATERCVKSQDARVSRPDMELSDSNRKDDSGSGHRFLPACGVANFAQAVNLRILIT